MAGASFGVPGLTRTVRDERADMSLDIFPFPAPPGFPHHHGERLRSELDVRTSVDGGEEEAAHQAWLIERMVALQIYLIIDRVRNSIGVPKTPTLKQSSLYCTYCNRQSPGGHFPGLWPE